MHVLSLHFTSYSYLTLFGPMDFSTNFNAVKSGWSIVYIEGSQVITSQNLLCFFHLGLQYLQEYPGDDLGVSSPPSAISIIGGP